MFLLGLTGDIASGKSSVARLLQERGAAHLDSDALVHELYRDADFARRLQTHLRQAIENAEFHDRKARETALRVLDSLLHHEISNADKTNTDGANSKSESRVNRRVLGELVFADATLLRHLEAFVHPAVARLREEKLAQFRRKTAPPRVVVLEAVKLVESGEAQNCDAVWWVCAARATQQRRLQENRGLSEEDATRRIENQPSRDKKMALLRTLKIPFSLLPNDETPAELAQVVAREWQSLRL